MIDFLSSLLSSSIKKVFCYCFMATDSTYWNDILIEEGYTTNKENIELMKFYLGYKEYSVSDFVNFLDFVTKNPFFERTSKCILSPINLTTGHDRNNWKRCKRGWYK